MDKGPLQYVLISKIKVGTRVREDMGNIEELAESIRDKGVITPITLNERLELRAGGRRLAAAKLAGVREIPALIRKDRDTVDPMEVELIENVFRKDFTPFERAEQIKRIHEYCSTKNIDWSQRKTALLLGHTHHKNVERDLKLAEAVQAFPELRQLKTADEAHRAIKKMEEGLVVAELRRRQEEQIGKGTADLLKVAKDNYRIGSCFDGMAKIRTSHINFIELDPPYGIALNEQKGGAGQRAKGLAPDSKVVNYNEVPHAEYPAFILRMATETFRVADRNAWMICWFGMTHFHLVQGTLRKAGWLVNDIPGIWIKPSGQTAAPEFNLANCYEPFFICRKGQPVLVKRGRSNVFEFDPVPPASKYHPTERPVALIQEILDTYTMPGQTCMVPCLGSGATLRACYLNGVTGFGWDLSKEYLDRFLIAVQEDMAQLDAE